MTDADFAKSGGEVPLNNSMHPAEFYDTEKTECLSIDYI
jgi:hypothetical protein